MAGVSVVLPTYNGDRYISLLLDSILSQTYKDIEYLVIDDRSTDNTVNIVQNYINKDPRVHLYVNPVRLGINKNFERGIRLAKGKYIFLCDQDDIWDKSKVKKMITKIEKGYDLVYSDLKVINSSGNILSNSYHKLILTNNLQCRGITKYLLFRNITNGCSICFKNQLIPDILPFPDNIIYDWWLMFKVSTKYKIGKLDEQLVCYRLHNRNFIGFPVIDRSQELKVDSIGKSINSLTVLSKQENIAKYKKHLYFLYKYLNNRLQYIKYKSNLAKYYSISFILLFYFPRLYKYILKNLLEDSMLKFYTILKRFWLKINSRNL